MAAARTGGGYGYLAADGRDESHQSFAQLLDEALAVAGGLRSAGLEPGETVALIVPTPREFLTTFLGAACAGIIPAPLYPPARLDQFEAYLRQTAPAVKASRAAAVVTTAQLRRVLGTLQSEAPSVRSVIAIERLQARPVESIAHPHLDDPVFLQFTSGSTSDPKGVVLTQRNLAENVAVIAGSHGLRLTREDRGMSWLPLFHDMGLIGMALTVLYNGCTTEFLSPLAFLKRPSLWLRSISRLRSTISFAPNFAYELCVRRVQPREMADLDLSCWRVAGCGAEPVRADTLAAFTEKFAAVGFREDAFLPCYGMAEHTLAVTFPPLKRRPRIDVVKADELSTTRQAVPVAGGNGTSRIELVSCGRPFPGHEVRIADPKGRTLPDRHVGQILLKGPSVFRGYLGREALSRETLAGGWLHSGDLGYLAGGELYVCGRVKDTIIVNGRNYYPQDLEQAAADGGDVRKGRVIAFGTQAGTGRDRIVVVIEPVAVRPADDSGRARARPHRRGDRRAGGRSRRRSVRDDSEDDEREAAARPGAAAIRSGRAAAAARRHQPRQAGRAHGPHAVGLRAVPREGPHQGTRRERAQAEEPPAHAGRVNEGLMDILSPCYSYLDSTIGKATGYYPYFRVISSSDGPVVTVNGRRIVMLGSNNYLGLTHHPEVCKAAHDAIDRYGVGCTGSRFLNGNLDLHEQLEAELAEFTGKEEALVFSSGVLANIGTLGLAAAASKARSIFLAAENHASLFDGARLSHGAHRAVRGRRTTSSASCRSANRGRTRWW